jgi:hypothetical protein
MIVLVFDREASKHPELAYTSSKGYNQHFEFGCAFDPPLNPGPGREKPALPRKKNLPQKCKYRYPIITWIKP